MCAVNVGVSALAMRIGFEDSILISRALNCLLTAQKDAAEADAAEVAAAASGAGAAAAAAKTAAAAAPSPTTSPSGGGKVGDEEQDEAEEAEAEGDGDSDDDEPEPPVMLILAKVAVPIVVIDLINDLGRRQLPLLQLRSRRLGVSVAMEQELIDADVYLSVSGVYYNERLTVWEPMLEPWTCTVLCVEEGDVACWLCSESVGLVMGWCSGAVVLAGLEDECAAGACCRRRLFGDCACQDDAASVGPQCQYSSAHCLLVLMLAL